MNATSAEIGRQTVSGPQRYVQGAELSRGKLVIAACRSGSSLAAAVLKSYTDSLSLEGAGEAPLFLGEIDFQFKDSETCVRLDAEVSDCDVFLFQGLYTPESGGNVDRNLMALIAAVRAFREWGARHVAAVVPYFAYARQDRPTRSMREPTTVKLVADMMMEAGIDRIITAHPHSRVHTLFGKIPVHSLETVDLFAGEFLTLKGREDVIAVAPDGGALKFVSRFSRALNIKTAVAVKERSPDGSVSSELLGEMKGKGTAIVLDDMISSGETVYVLIRKLAEMSIPQIFLGATHNLCMESARNRLVELHSRYHLTEVLVTDSIAQTGSTVSLPFLRVRSLADILSRVINNIHYNLPIDAAYGQAV